MTLFHFCAIDVKDLNIFYDAFFWYVAAFVAVAALYFLPKSCVRIRESEGIKRTGFSSSNMFFREVPSCPLFRMDLNELVCELSHYSVVNIYI